MNDMDVCMDNPGLLPTNGPAARSVLVADDDASTRQFLAGALSSLGFSVALAVDGADALRQARATRFDALLLDCRMPHGGAIDVLRDLHESIDAASAGTPAFATSAEVTPLLRGDLEAAGFVGVIEKPCRIAALSHALDAVLGVGDHMALLNDGDALRASGDPKTMAALRQLLHTELVYLRSELHALAHDPAGLIERMHRLRSACGFCGATRLGAQAKALQGHAYEARQVAPAALDRFRRELEATLVALAP
jgi:two-component system, OmpR family, response regulator